MTYDELTKAFTAGWHVNCPRCHSVSELPIGKARGCENCGIDFDSVESISIVDVGALAMFSRMDKRMNKDRVVTVKWDDEIKETD